MSTDQPEDDRPDPLTVACPDCYAQPGGPCVIANHAHGQVTHASRRDSARLAAVEHGSCALCGHPLVLGQRTPTAPVEPWHPDPDHAQACPPLPDPARDWNAYAAAINNGARAGYPGPEHFRPAEPAPCGHTALTPGCGGCDPGAIEYVIEDGSRTPRPYDPTRDMRPPPLLCPECAAGKQICAGQALDPVSDQFVPCAGHLLANDLSASRSDVGEGQSR